MISFSPRSAIFVTGLFHSFVIGRFWAKDQLDVQTCLLRPFALFPVCVVPVELKSLSLLQGLEIPQSPPWKSPPPRCPL